MRVSRLALAIAGGLGIGLLVLIGRPAPHRAGPPPSSALGDGVPAALHCRRAVEGILETRTIRFQEASAALDPASDALIDEVAAALRPCAGSRIAITGHTDAQGDEPANVLLSLARARAVREALVARGIARSALRARGRGSAELIDGLDPVDPANRRIEFAIITPVRIKPTPIDTPNPG
ncbi:MAG: hypothetical protein RIQ99_257 [Pseudomonadota bacterium]